MEIIAKDFHSWLKILLADRNYFTGETFIKEWEDVMGILNYDERLTPKMPFVIGGEYSLKNIYVNKFEKIISFNSNLAKQIKNLPDGTKVEIQIT